MTRFPAPGFLLMAFLSLSCLRLSASAPVIANLTPGGTTSSSVELTWTVSGGESATVYDLRCSTAPITGANFASATVVGGLAAPTGGIESHTVSGLFPNTRYWFAVKAFAATGESAMSNVAMAETTTGAVSFATSSAIIGASSLYASANGDFNGDGKLDLVFSVGSGVSGNIVFYPGDGAGGFGAPTTTSGVLGNYPLRPVADDFNGDGILDLAVPNFFGNTVTLLVGDGNGGFVSAGTVSPGTEPHSLVMADFDRDGDLDLAVALWGGRAVAIYLGDGAGGFTLKGSYGGYGSIYDRLGSPRAADFDGDGILDLLVANYGAPESWGNTVGFMKGNGDGSFANAVNYQVGRQPATICVGDLDGDGKLDFTATCDLDQWVAVCLGNGDGTFAAAVTYGLGSDVYASRLADLDGDGDLDLFLTRYSAGDLAYLVGNGDGTFQAPASVGTAEAIRDLTIGDFDRDGKPDVMALGAGMANMYFLRNTTPWGPAGSFMESIVMDRGKVVGATVADDFDGDGRIDLAVADQFNATVSVMLGQGDGTFGAATAYAVGSIPYGVVSADLNRDGKPDLAVANCGSDTISILLGNGDGTFGAASSVAAGDEPNWLAVGDFNRDGNPDLALALWAGRQVQIFDGDGIGGFAAPRSYGVYGANSRLCTIRAADFDRDGHLDLLVSDYGHSGARGTTVSLFNGNGDGTFAAQVDFTVGEGPSGLVVGDFNRDGWPDAATICGWANTPYLLVNDGAGSFAPAVAGPILPGDGLGIAVGDFDRDGRLDLAATSAGMAEVLVMRGIGDGTFQPPESHQPSTACAALLEPADFNGDGRLDLAVSNSANNNYAILLNTAPAAPPPADGLVAWWQGEDNALDSVGGNHGTPQNGATYAAGIYDGRSFSFDGVDDYVDMTNAGALDFGTGDFSIAFWMNLDSLGYQTLVHKSVGDVLGGTNQTYLIEYEDTAMLRFRTSDPTLANDLETPVTVIAGQWYHVVAVRSGTVNRLYMSGELLDEQDNGVLADTGSGGQFRIGQHAPNGVPGINRFVDGRLDELKAFNRALSPAEIAALAGAVPNGFRFAARDGMPRSSQVVSDPVFAEGITAPVSISVANGEYQVNGGGWTGTTGTVNPGDEIEVKLNTSASFATAVAATLTIGGVEGAFTATTAAADDPPTDGLVAWWRGEDNALDSVGGHHGTISGGTAYTEGRSGRAFEFDGADSNVGVGMVGGFALNEDRPFSISAWIDTDNPAAHQVITGNYMGEGGGVGNYSTYLRIYDGNLEFYLNKRQVTDAVVTTAIGTGWHHLTATYNGDEMRLYLDGRFQASANRSTFFSGCTDNTRGWYHGDYSPETVSAHGSHSTFDGRIDELKFYDRALSATEVEDLSGVVPDSFAFTDQTGISPHLLTASEPITVTGTRYPAAIAVTGGEYEINASGTWLTSGYVDPNDQVRVHLMSSAAYGATVNATLTIGGVSDTFSVTTIAQHTVTFQTDGTPGATVNGAAAITQLVLDGEDCAGVLAVAPSGYDFLGWTGDYVGTDNPLTLINVTADLTVTANFAMEQVAVGSTFVLDAAAVTLPVFSAKPKVYAVYHDPVKDPAGLSPKKAAAKMLTKIDPEVGAPTILCEWTKKIKLYDAKAFKEAQAGGMSAAEWITPATMRDLPMDLHLVSKEVVDQSIQPLALAAPVIANVAVGPDDAKGNHTLIITGDWFGTKPPKAWREYVDAAGAIKRQAMKVVKPTEVNTAYRDSKGKPACMDPVTGASQVIVVVPAKEPKGEPNGTLVLENGVGMAAGPDLSVGTAWAIGTWAGGDAAIIGTVNGGLSWQVQVPAGAYPGHNGTDISAVDELTAWAALGDNGADGGIILHTTTGGANWVTQILPVAVPTGVKGIKGLSRDEAWAVGLAGPVLHTVDGGETWTVVPTDGITLVQVNRIDAMGDDIWIADYGQGAMGMVHSSDGGATWRRESLPDAAPGQGPMAVSIVDADVAWGSVREQDGLHRTTDGGDTWRVDAAGITGPNDIDDVCAVAADQAWMVQNISGASAGLAMFVDIGSGTPATTTWNFPDYVYEGVAAVDGRTAWIAGFGVVGAPPGQPKGSVRRTVNGSDWSQMPMPDPDFELWKISVVGARR